MIARFAIAVVALLAAGSASAETMSPDTARRFVAGKLFSYNCFDGSRGAGRIFADGSVVGTIQIRGSGPMKLVSLPAGTLRVKGETYCASLPGRTARSNCIPPELMVFVMNWPAAKDPGSTGWVSTKWKVFRPSLLGVATTGLAL